MEHDGRHFPNELKMFRRKKGLTQQEVADILGLVHRTSVSQWERGIKFPSGDDLLKLSLLYQAPDYELYADYIEIMHPKLLRTVKAIVARRHK
jgi:transcriptional regulator with XRE-family HTH domain